MKDAAPKSGHPRGCLRSHDPNADRTIVRGDGVCVWDDHGREYIDLTSSYSATNFGHAPARLIETAIDQMRTLSLVCGLETPWRRELVDRLVELSPIPQPSKAWLCTTGARAVEVAWKIAYAVRPGRLLSFEYAYHGRSLATANLSATRRSPLFQECAQSPLPFPYTFGCETVEAQQRLEEQCLGEIERRLEDQAASTSAVVVEPVVGANGYLFASDEFFQRLRQLTQRLGILMICDEIQMGLGRLGSLFACASQGWVPDLLVLGKSLGGGLVPISAVIGQASLLDKLEPGVESETFAGNPLACRLGLEVLELLESGEILENARCIGERLRDGLARLFACSGCKIAIGGRGACAVVEVLATSLEDAENRAKALAIAARDAGVLLHLTGPHRNRLVFIPALTMEVCWVESILLRLEAAWKRILGSEAVALQGSVD